MKIPLDWLKEFISLRAKPQEIADQLSMAGLEVEAVEEVNGETVLTLGITPNRADCLSLLGVAREISALQGKKLNPKMTVTPKGEGKIAQLLRVQVLSKAACPRYMVRILRGLQIKPSPDWMQKRLNRAGLRTVNNVVDCTNYVMWELGQPLHAFDYRFLRDRQIVVRQEKMPIKFKTLDGVDRSCELNDLFICDGGGPVALAGIMGGANSQIQEDTKDIVLEAAYFNPRQIHRTRKRLRLSTDSSYRFERGIDPNGVANALHRVTELILQTAGGKATVDWIDLYSRKIKPAVITLPLSEVGRILGVTFSSGEVARLLGALGFVTHAKGKGLSVQVPTYRPDITIPIDLVEEVARLKGYDKIPATLPKIQMNLPKQPSDVCAEKITIDCCLSLGFSQACHLSFTSLKKAELFCEDASKLVLLQNPLSEDHACLRPSLLPSLLDAVAFNLHRQRKGVKLFELKHTFSLQNNEVKISELCSREGEAPTALPLEGATQAPIIETKHLAVVATGAEWETQWQLKPKETNFYTLKGLLQRLTGFLHIEDLEFVRDNHGSWIFFQGKKIGWLSSLNPQLLKEWEIESEVYAFELNWEVLADASNKSFIHYKTLSKFPFVERDVALILDQAIPASKVEEAIFNFNNPWIKKILIFDLFKGGNLPQGKKSLAFRLRYASPEKTLTSEEVNQVHTELISRLENELSAQLRT
ncbi:MAG: phenylalanine--tRNA ligase subunit beta [Deltaproteobacteria bacterium]|nr:phenylalanine--tRNA ligase subunit beta [Deltaproteobacteria bacterium]